MRPHLRRLLVITLLSAACASLQAVPIQIAFSAQIPTQASNNGDGSLATWASESITTYNALNSPDLPSLPATGFKGEPSGPGPTGFTFGSGVQSITLTLPANSYLILSWGGSNLNVGNGNADILYFIDAAGSYNFKNEPNARGGLSSLHFYGATNDDTTPRIPDSGTTLCFLGAALLGLYFFRGTFQKFGAS